MSVDTTSTLSPGVQLKYDNKFLKLIKKKLKMLQVCTKETWEKNMGHTVDMVRYTRRSPKTAHLTEGSSGTESNMYITHIRATLQTLGEYYKPSTFFELVGRDPGLKKYMEVVTTQAAESIDLKAMSQAALSGGWPIRADLDTNLSASGQVTTGGTDTFTSTNITVSVNDDYNGGHGVFYDPDGPNYLVGFCISDSTTSSVIDLGADTGNTMPKFSGGTEYPDAMAEGITTADAARVAAVKDIGATDVISWSNINMAVATLQNNECEAFDNGYYIGICDSQVALDLRADSTWQNLGLYKDEVDGLLNGEIGMTLGIRWIQTTLPWQHAVDSYTYSATGAAHVVPIFGKDAIGMLTLEGQGNHIIVVGGPDKSDPLDQFKTIGWKVINAVKTKNAFGSVLLLCGATALA